MQKEKRRDIMRGGRERGFYFISLLMAILIIMILMGYYMGGNKEQPKPQPQLYMERSKGAACAANRRVVETYLQQWSIFHQGEKPTIEKLQQAYHNLPRCPEGGKYYIGEDGRVHCTKHPD